MSIYEGGLKMNEFEKMVQDVLKESEKEIGEGIKRNLKEQVIQTLSYSFTSQVKSIVQTMVDEELKDEILNILKENKPIILEETKKGLAKIGAKIAEVMYLQALKNLEIDSYKCGEIIKKIFD